MIDIRQVYRRRRLDRISKSSADVIAAMKRGATLRMAHTQEGIRWWLTPSGKSVSAKTAAHVVLSALVVADRDALFSDAPPQTYRYRFASGIAPTVRCKRVRRVQ
jgi:hypothetical protein